MINDIEQKRIRLYSQADEYTKALYASTDIGFALEKLFQKHSISQDLFSIGVDIIGDTVLGLIQRENIAKECVSQLHVSEAIANEISSALLHVIRPVGDSLQSIPEADKNMKEKLELRPQVGGGQTAGAREEKKEGGVRPLTREEVLKSITSSRTMAKDIRTATEKGALNEQKEMFGYSPHEDEDGVESERG